MNQLWSSLFRIYDGMKNKEVNVGSKPEEFDILLRIIKMNIIEESTKISTSSNQNILTFKTPTSSQIVKYE